LVETSHPGNIGAAARAMKVMGLANLYLVRPTVFPHPEATARASGADDVLDKAIICDSIQEAVKDVKLVIATSSRSRHISLPQMAPNESAKQALGVDSCAIVFGCERTGLSNEDIQYCHSQVTIPTHPDYNSLNLASAVQILCYELYIQANEGAEPQKKTQKLANNEEMEQLYEHLEKALDGANFLDKQNPDRTLRRFRRLFGRARLEHTEVQMIRGMLSALWKNKIKT